MENTTDQTQKIPTGADQNTDTEATKVMPAVTDDTVQKSSGNSAGSDQKPEQSAGTSSCPWKNFQARFKEKDAQTGSAHGTHDSGTMAILHLAIVVLALVFFVCGIVGLIATQYVPIGLCVCAVGALLIVAVIVFMIVEKCFAAAQNKRNNRYASVERALEIASELPEAAQTEAKLIIIKELLKNQAHQADAETEGDTTAAGK